MRNAIKWSAMVGAVVVSSVFAVSCMEPDEGSEGEDVGEVTEDEELRGMEIEEVGEVGEAEEVGPESERVLEGALCPRGNFCLWQHAAKEGWMGRSRRRGECINLDAYLFNDVASSWKNRSPVTFHVYEHADCRGRKFRALSGAQAKRMGSWNDRASSICGGPTCP